MTSTSGQHHAIDVLQNEYKEIHLPLYRAAWKGDWEAAERILDNHPDAIRARITSEHHTVLHVAAASGHARFVKSLVARVTHEDLTLETLTGLTALKLAAASGQAEVAKVLLEKERSSAPPPPPPQGDPHQYSDTIMVGTAMYENVGEDERLERVMLRTPINTATLYGRHEMVRFLYKSMDVFDDSQLETQDRDAFFVNAISMGIYDVALDMLKRRPELATAVDCTGTTALRAMANNLTKSSYTRSSSQPGIWEQLFGKCPSMFQNKEHLNQQLEVELLKLLWDQVHASSSARPTLRVRVPSEPNPLQHVAARNGNVKLLTTLADFSPDMIFTSDAHGRNIFHLAVFYRQEDVFKLIYEIGSLKDMAASKLDKDKNTMLHYASCLPPAPRLNMVSGAALQMQRELLWFKEVRDIVPPSYEQKKNVRGETAGDLFAHHHKKLMEEGEKWMKDTANSCMLVAALIATVVFAAAFTVPGGNKDEGPPVYLKKLSFNVFTILDSIALISSSTSILTFLSILTARYTEDDFMWSLPSKLVVGLSTLFVSIMAMMGAFSVTFFITFEEGKVGIAVAVAIATCIPVMWYALMMRHVFVDVFRSTFMVGSLFRSTNAT